MTVPEPPACARRICARCVLPESEPDIRLGSNGVCNVCEEYRAAGTTRIEPLLLETDFIKLIEKHRGKGEYDALVRRG